jgi:hypothetical protein
MKSLVVLFALLSLVSVAARAMEPYGSIGPGRGITLSRERPDPCDGSLIMNYDGTADCDGYCWQYGGIVPPYYGAFAECYQFEGMVCGIELNLFGIGYPCFGCDLYVWEDAGGEPGNVLSVTRDVDPCPVAIWPNVSTHDFAIDNLPVDGPFWVGYWTDASDRVCPYFIAADCQFSNGCPMTNIAPGVGYPTGWNSVSLVWGPTQAIGIGVWKLDEGTPTAETSWGRVKADFKQ